MEIKQIITREWIGKQGDKQVEIMGLGNDNNVYQWNKFEGKWELNIVKTAPKTNEPF